MASPNMANILKRLENLENLFNKGERFFENDSGADTGDGTDSQKLFVKVSGNAIDAFDVGQLFTEDGITYVKKPDFEDLEDAQFCVAQNSGAVGDYVDVVIGGVTYLNISIDEELDINGKLVPVTGQFKAEVDATATISVFYSLEKHYSGAEQCLVKFSVGSTASSSAYEGQFAASLYNETTIKIEPGKLIYGVSTRDVLVGYLTISNIGTNYLYITCTWDSDNNRVTYTYVDSTIYPTQDKVGDLYAWRKLIATVVLEGTTLQTPVQEHYGELRIEGRLV